MLDIIKVRACIVTFVCPSECISAPHFGHQGLCFVCQDLSGNATGNTNTSDCDNPKLLAVSGVSPANPLGLQRSPIR
jgi:hypothetical protein